MVEFLLSFWRTLGAHAPFLMLVLPLIGAGLSFFSGWMSADLARRTALTNTLLSCLAAVALVLNFRLADRPAVWQPPQMVSSLPWTSFPAGPPPAPRAEWRVTTGVDGIALPLLTLLPFVTLTAVTTLSADDPDNAMQFPWLLLWEATLVGTIASLDVMLWATFLLASIVPPVVLIGSWGGSQRREAARAYALLSASAAMLTVVGTFGVMVALAWMVLSSPRLVESLPLTFDLTTGVRALRMILGSLDEARATWSSDRLGIAPFLIGGAALFLPLPPWRTTLGDAVRQAPPGARLLLQFSLMGVGSTIVLRVVMPLFGDVLAADFVSFACAVAALAAAAGTASTDIRGRRAKQPGNSAAECTDSHSTPFAIVTTCVAAAGYFTGNPTIEAGSVVLVTNGLVALAIARLTETRSRRWSAVVLGLAFLPPFGGFSGTWILVSGLWKQGSTIVGLRLSAGVALLALVTLTVRLLGAAFADRTPLNDDATRTVRKFDPSTAMLVGLLTVASVALGLAPSFLVRRVLSALIGS